MGNVMGDLQVGTARRWEFARAVPVEEWVEEVEEEGSDKSIVGKVKRNYYQNNTTSRAMVGLGRINGVDRPSSHTIYARELELAGNQLRAICLALARPIDNDPDIDRSVYPSGFSTNWQSPPCWAGVICKLEDYRLVRRWWLRSHKELPYPPPSISPPL
jgi:hypothetical protein